MDGITDITITGVVSAVSEIVADSQDNARIFRDYDGEQRLCRQGRWWAVEALVGYL